MFRGLRCLLPRERASEAPTPATAAHVLTPAPVVDEPKPAIDPMLFTDVTVLTGNLEFAEAEAAAAARGRARAQERFETEAAITRRLEARCDDDASEELLTDLGQQREREGVTERAAERAAAKVEAADALVTETRVKLDQAREALAKAEHAAALHDRADLAPFRARAKPLCDRILKNVRAILADAAALDSLLADANDAAKRLRTDHAETVPDLDRRHRVMPLIEMLAREQPGIEASIIRFWPTILESIAAPLPQVLVGTFVHWISDLKPGPLSDDTRARFAALSTARGANFAAELDAVQAKARSEEASRAQAAIREFENEQARARAARNSITFSRPEASTRGDLVP